MRLLKSGSGVLKLEEFYSTIPPYAILSHRWEEEEVSLQELRDGTAFGKKGFEKLESCCVQAARDGFEYVWIDTCCIDKQNSVELQEAINSMFLWYKKSAICYAYLSDCSSAKQNQTRLALLQGSKWFTRGWTLQELIAPTNMIFYDCNWHLLGTKTDLKDVLSIITRINPEVLDGQDVELSSLAQRMSWAAERQTTRSEDIAYCLMGVFGVDMPLIYGEGGENAFIRLQMEIIKKSEDHSLFAWKLTEPSTSHGLLAPCPAHFSDSHTIVQTAGISPSTRGDVYVAALNCLDIRDRRLIGLFLAILDDGRFIRVDLGRFVGISLTADGRMENHRRWKPVTLDIPQQSLRQRPQLRDFHFHVVEKKARSATNRFLHSAFDIGQNILFIPFTVAFYALGLRHREPEKYLLSSFTSLGQQVQEGAFDFTLGVGGVAGLLFKGKHTRLMSPFRFNERYIVISLAINMDGSVSSDIINVKDSQTFETQDEEVRWLEEHILATAAPHKQNRRSEKMMANTLFRIDISDADGEAGDRVKRFDVRIRNGPKFAGQGSRV